MKRDAPAWEELARRIGGEIVPHWAGGAPLVQARIGHTIFTADAPPGDGLGYATRVRVVFLNRRRFRFALKTEGVLSELGKMVFGIQDIVTGHPNFDRRYLVQGTDVASVRALFADDAVRSLIAEHRRIHILTRPLRRWGQSSTLGGDLTDLDELVFRGGGLLPPTRVERVIALLRAMLDGLERLERRHFDDVTWEAWRLRGRGGSVAELHVELWNGDTSRRDAAARLGVMGDPRGVPALVEALEADDAELVAAALVSLAALDDERAVGPVCALLSDRRSASGRLLGDHAARTLEKLGARALVDAYHGALTGDDEPLRREVGGRAPWVARALLGVMAGSDLRAVEAAGRTLGWLGTMELVPDLRRIRVQSGWDRTQDACTRTIAELEAKASLPRPAAPAPTDHEMLPRAAGPAPEDPTRLPRSADAGPDEPAQGEPTDE